MNSKQQGDNAEIRYMLLAHSMGYVISKPISDYSQYDLIVDTGKELERIQVKSTSRKDTSRRMDCYKCLINRGKGHTKGYTKENVDYVAVYVIPEDTWYKIPVEEINGVSVKLYPHRIPKSNNYEQYKIVIT